MEVLFTGYAPVHFACFKPLHDRLAALANVQIRVSGGLRTKRPEGGYDYDPAAMYSPFGLAPGAVMAVEEIRETDVDLFFCANTKKIEPRSYGQSIEIFHGMSFRNRAIREANTDNDRYMLLGPYMRRGFEALGVFGPEDPRAIEVGFPKTDRLIDGSLEREDQLEQHGLGGERPVLLYAPTGAKRNSLETIGEEVLRRLASTGAYDILVKPHDHPKNKIDWFERLASLEDAHLRLVRDPDVVPTLFLADLLISDASSVANEYALLDRPTVFLDVPELLEAAAGAGSSLDLETWGRRGGAVAKDAAEAVAAVAAELARPERRSPVRRQIAADLFYNPGRAAEAALDWMRREHGVREESSLAAA